nr:hypothetical protein [Tanacetum cinerariifolium]
MATLQFADTHNMVAFLSKLTESDGFEQIVDFLNAHLIRYASIVNPTIYISCIEQFWFTAMAKTINEEARLHAKVDGKKIIVTKSSVRKDLRLADEKGIDCLPDSTISEQIALMGNWVKVQQFSLIPNTPTIIQPQKIQKPRKPIRKDTQVPHPSGPTKSVADKAVHKELGDRFMRAATTASSLEAEHDSESSGDEESLGEDASKQERRIDAIDADEDIMLVSVQDNADKEMFDVDTLVEEITLDQALEALKTSKPEVKGIVFQEPRKSTTKIYSQQSLDKGKGIMKEEHVKPKKKDQIRLDEEVAKKLQAKFDKEERLAREKAKKEERAYIALIEKWDDIQEKIDADHQLAERLQA